MTKHTPGPWMVCNERPDEILMDDSKGEQVFALVAFVETDNCCKAPQWQADARLIAAAPELLAAVIALTKIINDMRCDDDFDANTCDAGGICFGDIASDALEAAEAAIAKASEKAQ